MCKKKKKQQPKKCACSTDSFTNGWMIHDYVIAVYLPFYKNKKKYKLCTLCCNILKTPWVLHFIFFYSLKTIFLQYNLNMDKFCRIYCRLHTQTKKMLPLATPKHTRRARPRTRTVLSFSEVVRWFRRAPLGSGNGWRQNAPSRSTPAVSGVLEGRRRELLSWHCSCWPVTYSQNNVVLHESLSYKYMWLIIPTYYNYFSLWNNMINFSNTKWNFILSRIYISVLYRYKRKTTDSENIWRFTHAMI